MGCESPGSKPRCLIVSQDTQWITYLTSGLSLILKFQSYILAVRYDLVLPRGEKVEQRDHVSLELWAAAGVHCGREEGLPHDGLAGVGSDEIKYKL